MKRSILCGLAAAVALGACSSGQGEALSTEGTFTVAITPAELTLEARGTAAATVTIARLDGFADVVEVSPAGLPAGISADPLVISPSQSSGQLVLRSGGTEAASRVPVTVTATSSSHTSTAAFALTLVGSFGLRLELTSAAAVVFVGERTSLTAVFDGDFGIIDGVGRVQSGVAVETPLLSRTTTFTLHVTRGSEQVEARITVQANYRKYRHSPARTDLLTFEGRTHWLIKQEGWVEVARQIDAWLQLSPRECREQRSGAYLKPCLRCFL